MSDLLVIVKATRASAKALADCHRIAHRIADMERSGDTANAAATYPALCRAQRRYARAQQLLAANPLPGDAAYKRTVTAQ